MVQKAITHFSFQPSKYKISMGSNSTFIQLQSLTERLLTVDTPAGTYQAITHLHTLITNLTGLETDHSKRELFQGTFLDGGEAISPYDAATCLSDIWRTACYLRGIYSAIRAAQTHFAGERIHILYAGCGPYATLLLPLITQFRPEEIGVTLLDFHTLSIEQVTHLIETLNIADYIDDIRETNAITYTYPPQTTLHMVVVETMFRALGQETQVAIMQNLLPQLTPGGFFLPEAIHVSAGVADPTIEDSGQFMILDEHKMARGWRSGIVEQRAHIGHLLTLNRETVGDLPKNGEKRHLTTLPMPPHPAGATTLYLQTTITVYEDHHLEPYACDLTYPVRVNWWEDVPAGTPIDFYFTLGYKPGIEIQTPQMTKPRIVYEVSLPKHLQQFEETY